MKTPSKTSVSAPPTVGERLFARWYPWLDRRAEAAGVGALRTRALSGVRGRTLEVGAGHGANLSHYPAAAGPLVLTDPSAPMLAQLREAAGSGERAGSPEAAGAREVSGSPEAAGAREVSGSPEVSVVRAGAESLPFPDGSFDAVVATFVLCSVDDQSAALAEIARVLADGGRFHFLEHVRASDGTLLARAQDAVEVPHRIVGGGCRPNRRTEAAIRATPGLTITELETGSLPGHLPFVRPCIWGAAVRGPRLDQARSTSSGA